MQLMLQLVVQPSWDAVVDNMKINEIITEDDFDDQAADDMIEDDAVHRGDDILVTTLDYLSHRAQGKHLVPKVRADSLINMVQNTGHPEFNFDTLDAAFNSNNLVKSLIDKIEDGKNGVKYVYLSGTHDEQDKADEQTDHSEKAEKTVGSMAKRALKTRE